MNDNTRVMRRRLLLGLAAGAVAPSLRAQPSRSRARRVGILSSFSPSDSAAWHQALEDGLRELGWIDGKNLSLEYRFAEGRNERLAELAASLARLEPDVIVADESTDAQAAHAAAGSVPIVMASAGAAVEIGLAESLARPGGMVTGLVQRTPELAGKHLQLLREIMPRLSRLAVLWNPRGKTSELGYHEMQTAARQAGITLQSYEVSSGEAFARVFDEAVKARAGAVSIMPHPVFATNLPRIAEFAQKNRLPSIFHLREFPEAGGLIAYGPNRTAMFRRAATYVDKVLKGAKPGELPIEQPTVFDLVVNVRTARALGISIPRGVLLRADKVIE